MCGGGLFLPMFYCIVLQVKNFRTENFSGLSMFIFNF